MKKIYRIKTYWKMISDVEAESEEEANEIAVNLVDKNSIPSTMHYDDYELIYVKKTSLK